MTGASWSGYVGTVSAAFRNAYALPSELAMPAFGYPFRQARGGLGTARARSDTALSIAPALSTVIVFTLDSSGGMSGLRVAASSLSGAADASAMAALTSAATAHAFPAISVRTEPETGPLRSRPLDRAARGRPIYDGRMAVSPNLAPRVAWSLSRRGLGQISPPMIHLPRQRRTARPLRSSSTRGDTRSCQPYGHLGAAREEELSRKADPSPFVSHTPCPDSCSHLH